MKRVLFFRIQQVVLKFIVACLFIIFVCEGCTERNRTDHFNIQDFKHPSRKVGVHTWWHWMDGRITRDGITKDLESMKRQGVLQATILNVGMSAKGSGVDKIIFNTEEWYDMFEWALKEANRLGIIIGIHNCDGWSESGGPWITPEMSMKKFVFSKTRITQDMNNIVLPKPLCETDFYRDVAVVAFKKNNNQMFESNELPRVTVNDTIDGMLLMDGNPESMLEVKNGDVFRFENQKKILKTRISLMQNFKGAFYFPGPKTIEYSISASDDGIHFKKITEVATNKFYVNAIIDIPPTSAKYFQVKVKKIHKLRPWHHAALAELSLLGKNEEPAYNPTIVCPLEKTASARVIDIDKLYVSNSTLKKEDIVDKTSIVDLTDKMTDDGTLTWKAPAGNWAVIRFGYTTTGAKNGPATKEGVGLECDKMDTAALSFHFSQFPRKLIEHAGAFTGNTFKFFLIDSWERGYQTWTGKMPEEFRKLRGYNLINWIPVLCGETVENTEVSEGFLYDFRKTIADLFERNYYKHFYDLCHENGLELHGEVIYGDNGPFPPVDVLKTNDYMDMPMYEFWADLNSDRLVQYTPRAKTIRNFPVYAANFYNKPIIGTEAFTGFAHYSESPADLKLFGDRAFCSGINQMILHSYVHQPCEKKPGITLGQHGSHFNRHYPAWQHAQSWLEYLSRVQYILQKGVISSEVLYFLGDQYPQFFENNAISSLPNNYQTIPCNYDVLTKLSVRNNKLQFAKNQRFSILVLPDRPVLEYQTLKEVARLIKQGALVYGVKPLQMFSLKNKKEKTAAFKQLADEIWKGYTEEANGQNNYGSGVVIWGKPLDKVVEDYKIMPDFTSNCPDSLNLMYIHKNTAGQDVFYVVNQKDSVYHRECVFKVPAGRIPTLWNPMTGEVKKVMVYTKEAGSIRIPVTFMPEQSLFFIFTKDQEDSHICKIETGEDVLFPSGDVTKVIDFPRVCSDSNGNVSCVASEEDDYKLTNSRGDLLDIKSNVPDTLLLDNICGKIILYPINSDQTDTLAINKFKSFTDWEIPAVKYFSGTAVYEIDFSLPKEWANSKEPVALAFADFDATAELILNGHSLGTIWSFENRFPVGQWLKETNHLTVTIGTTVRNRIIGDYNEHGNFYNVWTSGPVKRFLNKNSVLKPSGIIDPVMLIKNW